MADIKFACPHCQQHIQAESGYAGLQINCPACHGSLLVPGTPAAPPPPPPPAPVPASPPAASAPGCPSCGAALGRGAVLCTKCGYNLATGKRTVAGKPVAAGRPAADPWKTPWYKTAYPYVGVVVLILAVLYFLGRENPGLKLAFVGVAALYVLTVHIIVAVAAFRQGIGTGFLTLCIPLFAIYFVFKMNDNDTLQVLYGFAIVINIALKFIE
jgi:hypothetical protein